MKIIIDPEFRDVIPKLTDDEFKQLEQNIVKERKVFNPLVLWGDTLVDGHNRYAIIQKHPEVEFTTIQHDFPNRYAAIAWIYSNQLGRRNLTNEQKHYLIGKQYEAQKAAQGGDHGNQYTKAIKVAKAENLLLRQSTKSVEPKNSITAVKVGKEHGVSHFTVKEDEKFAKGVDEAEKLSPGMRDGILSGKIKVPKKAVAELPKMPEEQRISAIEEFKSGKKRVSATKAELEAIRAQVAETRDLTRVPVMTLDDLVEILGGSLKLYTDAVNSTLKEYKPVLDTAENKQKIIAVLSEAEAAIEKIKEVHLT